MPLLGERMDLKTAAFLLIKTPLNAYHVARALKNENGIRWASAVYGPYQVVAYLEAEDHRRLAEFVESVRTQRDVAELDARLCKIIPEDAELKSLAITKSAVAVLLINVKYQEEKERTVTCRLRQVTGVQLARAMWGPTDIVAFVEADDHESLRNIICDEIKIMKGVLSNATLYCYPEI